MSISLNILILAAAIVGGATYIGLCIKEASRNVVTSLGLKVPNPDVLDR